MTICYDCGSTESMNLRQMLSNLGAKLDALTVSSLKDLLSVLTGKDVTGRHSRADLIALIHGAGRPDEIDKLASRLETLLPRRHTWLFSFSNPPKAIDQDSARQISASLKHLLAQSSSDDTNQQRLAPEDFVEDTIRNRHYFKFVHYVKSINWEYVDAAKTKKEIREVLIRHAVVVVIRLNEGILEVRFNGYKQGLATPHHERLQYSAVVRETKGIVETAIGLNIVGLHLHDAASELITETEDVVAIRVVIRPSEGGEIILDTGEGSSARDIPELIQRTFGTSSNASEIRQALRDSPTDSLLLLWKQFHIMTRLAFSDLGTELLYIWRFTDKSEDVLDAVFREILKRYTRANASPTAISAHVAGASAGDVFLVSHLCQRFQTSPEDAIKELEQLVIDNQIHRCFRFRTRKVLHDYSNQWVSALSDLPEQLEDEDGVQFSSFDPSVIEFGYRK